MIETIVTTTSADLTQFAASNLVKAAEWDAEAAMSDAEIVEFEAKGDKESLLDASATRSYAEFCRAFAAGLRLDAAAALAA